MRWELLFADLEAQWAARQRRELDAEVADRTRRERALVGLADRIATSGARPVVASLVDGSVLVGPVLDAGRDWLLLDAASGRCLLPYAALTAIKGPGSRARPARLGRSFPFGFALRALSRDRAVVVLRDRSGADATGTIDGVGRDYLELAEHPADAPRRPEHVTGRRLVPFDAIVLVRQA